MKQRYKAQWIDDYDGPDDAGFDPCHYRYESAFFGLKRDAETYAKNASMRGPCPDWFRVYLEEWNPNYYEPGAGEWEEVWEWNEAGDSFDPRSY